MALVQREAEVCCQGNTRALCSQSGVVCALSVGMYDYGVEGGEVQQEEHLRLSWHQVLLSCLNESNLPSPPLPSFTKQISFAVCSSLLIQLPPALSWVHQLPGPSLIRAAHCHPLIGIKYHQFQAPLTKKEPSLLHRLLLILPHVQRVATRS